MPPAFGKPGGLTCGFMIVRKLSLMADSGFTIVDS
jgi:hypothetical protein